MIKLILIELRKLLNKRSIFVVMVIILLFNLLNNILFYTDYDSDGNYKYLEVENIEEEKKILGILGYYILFDDAQITTIATLKEARGRGIATKLMEYLIDDCNKKQCSVLSLEVRESNLKAQNLYRKFDFIEMNVRKGYYEDGEDALFMMKALGGNYE